MSTDNPIDVNGDLTPISHVQIKRVRYDLWRHPKASVEFLQSQREILQDRLSKLRSVLLTYNEQPIVDGIAELDWLIQNKMDKENEI